MNEVPISISSKICLYLVPFLKFSASKNGVTSKMMKGVVQDHRKWRQSIDIYYFLLVRHCIYNIYI